MSDVKGVRSWREVWRSSARGSFMLIGAFAAGLTFIGSNVLASRFFHRWDVTPDGLYSLSPATVSVLERVTKPLEVIVLLGRGDELTPSVRYLLDAYRERSPWLRPRFVDPDRDPAEFLAVQRKYGLLEGKTEDGRVATDASMVLAQEDRRWFITTDDMASYDEESGAIKPRLEQALTEGIAQLQTPVTIKLCVSRGQGELGWHAEGPQGLAEFRSRLERNNFELREVDLGRGNVSGELAACDVVLVLGPAQAFSAAAEQEVLRALDGGTSLVLALGPVVDDEGRIRDGGLGTVLQRLGVRAQNDVVFERDTALQMPLGIGGEVFLASPVNHPVTLGMLHGEEIEQRVLLQLSQSFEKTKDSPASPLLQSSAESIAIDDFRGVQSGSLAGSQLTPGTRMLAAAVQLEPVARPTASPQSPGQQDAVELRPRRAVIVGTPSIFWSSAWQEPALLGTRRFAENVVAWVAAKPTLVSVPEKAAHPAGVALSEEGVGEVQRYVLLYMPACAALVGFLSLLRRRQESLATNAKRAESGSK